MNRTHNGLFRQLSFAAWLHYKPFRTAGPNFFGTRDWFHGRQFFHELERGGELVSRWFKHVTFIAHFISIIITSAHLKSPGIRSQRLGTPILEHRNHLSYTISTSWCRTWNVVIILAFFNFFEYSIYARLPFYNFIPHNSTTSSFFILHLWMKNVRILG